MANAGFTLEKEVGEKNVKRQEFSLEHFNHVKKVNDVFYDQVKSADQKAAYIFTFMLAFLMWSAEGQGVFNLARYENNNHLWGLVSVFLAISIVFTIICAILVVLPRRVDSGTSLFWGAWSGQRDRLVDASETGDMAYLFGQYLENADAMSQLAINKYRMVRFAFRGLLMTVVAYVVLLLARQ
ncbi:hypothetical protein IB238_12890 [Rhizobium sp. ARZ01]|uniref:Pycsar system effector family protein n=1 Tax=Rhizobium sp. ARZ01 TaxID=2769313 RepID=UPI00178638ED|nr:Pycsar system effector family protein [Rhizobium sp. ARZ01]MBD9373517.1 hypothetical protein [Rhizobium sp. ARZ01]